MLFELDAIYNFNTISTTVLKPYYKNLKAVSYLGFKQAVKYSGVFSDVVTIRQQLVNETSLPLIDSREARYVLFEDEYGTEILLAEDWIRIDSIDLVTSITLQLTISNITSSDTAVIINTLRAMGYNGVESKLL